MRKRILLVDDEPALLYALEHYLDGCGYEVHCASELEQASALLVNRQYDAVVTDLRLTALQAAEGLEVIQLIRERNLTAKVVVLTGAATREIEAEAHRLGVDCFLQKPARLALVARTLADLT